jgi:hypothetical protein
MKVRHAMDDEVGNIGQALPHAGRHSNPPPKAWQLLLATSSNASVTRICLVIAASY